MTIDKNDDDNDHDHYNPVLHLRTYGDLKRDHEKFVLLDKNKKMARECHSTINPPLFKENDEVLVAEKCPAPELHCMLGFVNHVFFDGLIPLLGVDKAMLWPYKVQVVPKNYQGLKFEGNPCRKLLKSADLLNDPEIYENVGELAIVPYISALKAMDKLVNKFFSTRKIDADLNKYVEELRRTYVALDISETLKAHVVLQHLPHCLQFLNGNGLGVCSEQAGETMHSLFLKYMERYSINFTDHESFGKRVKKATVEFSSEHL